MVSPEQTTFLMNIMIHNVQDCIVLKYFQISDDQRLANSDPLVCLDTNDENDSDDDNRCCSDSSDVSSDNDDDEFDLNDFQTANTGSVTNESSGPKHENSVAVVVNPLPLIQSPAHSLMISA